MLQVRQIETGYGKKQVLFGCSLEVQDNEIVAVIGPNGAGKSTILKAIHGAIPLWKGEIRFQGAPLNGSSPAENVALGITYCPQGNRVFDKLNVMENLKIGALHLRSDELHERIKDVLQLFPILKDRLDQKAGKLSGGEQQMVALGRALITKPRLLMLDEPSLGLSPSLVITLFEKISRINSQNGMAILIVEQKVHEVIKLCHRVYGVKLGKVILDRVVKDLLQDTEELRRLFL